MQFQNDTNQKINLPFYKKCANLNVGGNMKTVYVKAISLKKLTKLQDAGFTVVIVGGK